MPPTAVREEYAQTILKIRGIEEEGIAHIERALARSGA